MKLFRVHALGPRLITFLAVAACGPAAHAGYIETFDNGLDDGGWRLTFDPNRLLGIAMTGGNPGAFLYGEIASAIPAWFVPAGVTSPFLGNYQAQQVSHFSADLNILLNPNPVPDRSLTLDLKSTQNTGLISNLIEAYEIGPDISHTQPGWNSYSFSLPAASATIPAGWTVIGPGGHAGTDADWRALMADVETVGLELYKPGFAYPQIGVWQLGLDNPALVTAQVPEPSYFGLFGVLSGLLLGRAAVRLANGRN